MFRSNSDQALDLKGIGLLALAFITTHLLAVHTHNPATPSEYINQKTRKVHAVELLGKSGAAFLGATNQWVPGVMEAFIETQVKEQLPTETASQAHKIANTIVSESRKQNLDPMFVLAVIKRESGFNPKALGTHGEIGMMQIKPSTARWISEKFGLRWRGDESLFDPVVNIQVSTTYLALLRDSFHKNARYYIAAYNMGPQRARELMAENIIPTEYSSEVMGNYRSYYHNIDSGKNLAGGHFTVSMVQASRGLAFSQIGY